MDIASLLKITQDSLWYEWFGTNGWVDGCMQTNTTIPRRRRSVSTSFLQIVRTLHGVGFSGLYIPVMGESKDIQVVVVEAYYFVPGSPRCDETWAQVAGATREKNPGRFKYLKCKHHRFRTVPSSVHAHVWKEPSHVICRDSIKKTGSWIAVWQKQDRRAFLFSSLSYILILSQNYSTRI